MQVVQATRRDRGETYQQLQQVHREKFTNVSLTVYRAICAEYNLEDSKDWSVEPEKIVNNDRVKILRDFST